MNKEYPDGCCCARRLGIMQSGKLRCVDELSKPGINAAFGNAEKLNLLGIDTVASLLRLAYECIGSEQDV